MIDPLTALAGIQSAISMVKKASKVANDLGSLAPMIGKMFDAKSTATKALIEAKKGKGSNMGTALQIEMALEQARAFEARWTFGTRLKLVKTRWTWMMQGNLGL
jgi:hypothetical protein